MIKLTSFSPGAGCGCKISPAVLEQILGTGAEGNAVPPGLLVGYNTKDDAAVFDLGDGRAVISTTDFFTPICDDPYDFGRIASANAISDIYAMGGRPLMAISILGWPLEKLPAELAAQVLEGSRAVCREAGIPLAGGHSIDSLEPIFGLAVTGIIDKDHIKSNSTALPGDLLLLTKPLGVGILSTAQKMGLLQPDHATLARDSMVKLNNAGPLLATIPGVTAMTDVTGFGLLGHLAEMCEGSGVSARVHVRDVPVFPEIYPYIEKKCVPGGTNRNWKSYGHKITGLSDLQRTILADPQTNGGLLVAVRQEALVQVKEMLAAAGQACHVFGNCVEARQYLVMAV